MILANSSYKILKKDGKIVDPSEVINKLIEIVESGKCGEFLKGWEIVEIKDEVPL